MNLTLFDKKNKRFYLYSNSYSCQCDKTDEDLWERKKLWIIFWDFEDDSKNGKNSLFLEERQRFGFWQNEGGESNVCCIKKSVNVFR